MRFKKALIPVFTVILVVGQTGPSFGWTEYELLFKGFSRYEDGDTPDQVGSRMEVFGILSPVTAVLPPFPLYLDQRQYTIHVSGLTVATSLFIPPIQRIITFTGGEIQIYSDPFSSGTTADFSDGATFIDGEVILSALLDNGWRMNLVDFHQDGAFAGSGAGEFTGGTRVSELDCPPHIYVGEMYLIGSPIAEPNGFVVVPTGYHRLFDSKVTAQVAFDIDQETWGEVKGQYR